MADAKDFLFEIGTEEMPSAPLNNAVKQLGTMIAKGLDEAGLAHGEVRVISSPRRLAALVADVATATDEVHEVKRGPAANIAFDADGNATKAAQGFARKCGVAAEDLVRREDTDGREYVFAEKNIPSAPATPILTALCEKTIAGLQWPNYRSQRWGHEHATFVRPVRWICCLLGEDVVPVSFADVTSGNTTRGHRVLGPGDHVVASPAAYEQVLEDAGVLSAERRREAILAGISEVEAARPGCHVDTPKKVFEEVINLCEWPTVLVGTFDEEFLKVPHEIICESMLTNQRYFPIYDGEGKLTREFVVVSNSKPENAERVIDGNERVVRARLDDAKFFYEEDLKISLDEFRERLSKVAFQEKLGSVLAKSERIEQLALAIAREAHLGAHLAADAARAAHLCKADLVSNAVVEFTSQQGVMGGYYATAMGENDEVAHAIRDHYRPRFAGDELPKGTIGRIVGISDKIDNIVATFSRGLAPTGSQDPYALRRQALGIINILISSNYHMPLIKILAGALYLLNIKPEDTGKLIPQILEFFKLRLKNMMIEQGIRYDVVDAVFADERNDDLVDIYARCKALNAYVVLPEAEAVIQASIRVCNLCKKIETEVAISSALFADPAEQELHDVLIRLNKELIPDIVTYNYAGALKLADQVVEPVNKFFDSVMVMDENVDIKNNRLALLEQAKEVTNAVGDLSCIVL